MKINHTDSAINTKGIILKYKNIMVIDDSHFDRLIADKVIQLSGLAQNTIIIDSAMKALGYLAAEEGPGLPEIIFLDISMPEMDGFGFLEEFGSLPPWVRQTCRIFMLSSSADSKDIMKAKRSPHITDFVMKPLTVKKLRELI